jgi:hypothetical protein
MGADDGQPNIAGWSMLDFTLHEDFWHRGQACADYKTLFQVQAPALVIMMQCFTQPKVLILEPSLCHTDVLDTCCNRMYSMLKHAHHNQQHELNTQKTASKASSNRPSRWWKVAISFADQTR